MTIGSIVFVVLAALSAVIGCIVAAQTATRNKALLAGAILLTAALIIGGICWWSFGTESGKRAYKDQQSNLTGGIERTVKVYDMEGDLIAQYDGRFDVETTNEYILFDDEQGKRHIIYFTTGTVIIDER